jgi:hypothetical protein
MQPAAKEHTVAKSAGFIDPAQKICIMLTHPGDKNKDVARAGHPNSVAVHKGRINNLKGAGFGSYIDPAELRRPLAAGCPVRFRLLFAAAMLAAPLLPAQNASSAAPIAIVPIDSKNPDAAAKVTGALEVSQGRAVIAASGTVSSGNRTTEVLLPHRGVLRVCAFTTVKLAADATVSAGETPGLLVALDHGAIETSFATGRNSDILLTPDFRILIGAHGASEVKVRLGPRGDTCVDNSAPGGANAPYVLVTSVFDESNYRVQPGQRVMFEHGSLREVVDNEKEPCGCPPPAKGGNDFPLAQSEGLEPTPKPAQTVATTSLTEPLVYKGADHAAEPAPAASAAAAPPPAKQKPGLLSRVGRFFRRIFGAE